MAEIHEVFRGHLDECLAHLAKCFAAHVPKNSREAGILRIPIAEFCGVRDCTIARWFRDTQKIPNGQTRVRLMCYLDMLGYRVLELEKLKNRRGFTELVGYGLLTAQEIVDCLEYGEIGSIFRIFQPGFRISPEKEQLMWDIWKQKKEELEQKKVEAREKYLLDFPLVMRSERNAVLAKPSVQPGRSKQLRQLPNSNSAVIRMMEVLDVLIVESGLDELSGQGLKNLSLDYRNVILRLSSHLNNLSFKLVTPDQ